MKIHPNEYILEEFLLSLSQEHLSVVEHMTRCATCRRRTQWFLQQRAPSKMDGKILAWPAPDYRLALLESGEALRDRETLLFKERIEAPGLFVELTSYPPEKRDLVLQNSPRFHTWGVFELLIERSLEGAIRDPDYAEELGLLALRLADYLDRDLYLETLIEDLRARAWGYVANSYRLRSHLRKAEDAFAAAYGHLKKGTQDPLERAILLDLEASLRRDQRRFEDASKLLDKAVAIFLQNGQRHLAGRSLVNLSTILHFAGDPEGGIPILSRAIELIDPEQEPRLLLCAKHNLIDDLAAGGRFLEAQRLYSEARSLYRNFPDAWTQNRRKWIKGKIVRGLGQADQAESLFLAARDGFLQEGIPYDTALVSLELATLYAEQGRMADLKRLAEEMVPIFSSLHIHREALAALAFLQQAVESEQVSLELVRDVAAYLRRAQHDPILRFQELAG